MYINGQELGIRTPREIQKAAWPSDDGGGSYKNGKCFVKCICPKCTAHHRIYMRWAGRGIPRKYCTACRPQVAGYDEAALHEAVVSFAGHSRKRGRRNELE